MYKRQILVPGADESPDDVLTNVLTEIKGGKITLSSQTVMEPEVQAVSYTHLDVYKRQSTSGINTRVIATPYAAGGFPEVGELFIAREAGPELVGRMGSRTVVALSLIHI